MVKKIDGRMARELMFELFDQGKKPSDDEVKALRFKSKTRYNYYQIWKKQQATPPEAEKGSESSPKGSSKKVVGGVPIEVGKITITPENWGMTQHGAIIILDTYNKAKRDINYGGTIGDFLCDVTVFYRRILNYEEVEYARATSEGGGGSEEDGRESAGRVLELAEG